MTNKELLRQPNQTGEQPSQTHFGRNEQVMLVYAAKDLYGVQRSADPTASANERREFRTRLSADRKLVTQILGITDITQVDRLREVPAARQDAKEHATRLIAGTFEIAEEEAAEKLQGFAKTADAAVDLALIDFPEEIRRQGEESVVRDIDHPVDLLLMATDSTVDNLDRYRALRKARLIQIAAEIDLSERQARTEASFDKFKNFLVDDVLNQPAEDDQKERFILSMHDISVEGRFKAVASEIVTRDDLQNMPELTHGQKLTPVLKRTFTVQTMDGEVTREIYIPNIRENDLTRRKTVASMVLKAERKSDQTPTQAIDDQIGMMAVFEDQNDIFLFLDHMEARALEKGSLLHRQEPENTLNGGEHKAVSNGSSTDLHWYKAHLRMFGVRPEFMGFNPTLLTNYLYQEGVSHREYATDRLFKDGVAERLIPHERFGYDPEAVQAYAKTKVRSEIQNPKQVNGYPPQGA